MALTFLDLCAGIGGISLGLTRAGMTCVGQVEIDEYCNNILRRHWPDVPRWRDITKVEPAELPRAILIAGGYPCQPFSVAGKRQGAGDNRHLWPFVVRIVAYHRPAWCLFENVAGHVSLGLDAVCSDLEGLGYACGPLVVPACAVDAPHRRDRVWSLAHAGRARWRASEPAGDVAHRAPAGRPQTSGGPGASGAHGRARLLAHAHGLGRLQGGTGATGRPGQTLSRRGGASLWPTPKASPSGPDFARRKRPGSGGDDLATAVARAFLPTPTASQEAKNSTLPPSQMKRDNLAGYLLRNGERGQLNPEWVEWLMGFPAGWTVSEG